MPCSRTSSASYRLARARETWSVPTICAKTLSVFTRAECGSSHARRAAMSSITTSKPSVYARFVASVERPISSSRAADGQPSLPCARTVPRSVPWLPDVEPTKKDLKDDRIDCWGIAELARASLRYPRVQPTGGGSQ